MVISFIFVTKHTIFYWVEDRVLKNLLKYGTNTIEHKSDGMLLVLSL